MGREVSCVLCKRSEETKVTGRLLTKAEVTAHQNCLLYSSGIFCQNTPQFDDLFGFSVDDVLDEVKRGSKLICSECQKRGATAGCEVGRCKKSFHYPCAVQANATMVVDDAQGKYSLYCYNHNPHTQENNASVNGSSSSAKKSRTSKDPSEAGTSKVNRLTCEKSEGNRSLGSVVKAYFDKHAPASCKGNSSGDSAGQGHNSDSSSSSSGKLPSSKRPLSNSDKQEATPSKRRVKRIASDDSSNSDEKGPELEMSGFAPLETDLDESGNSIPESQLSREDTEGPTEPASGNPPKDQRRDENQEESIVISDAESDSLMSPVSESRSATKAGQPSPTTVALVRMEVEMAQREDDGPSPEQGPDQHTTGPPLTPDRFKSSSAANSPQHSSSSVTPPPHETSLLSLRCSRSPSPPMAPPSEPEASIDSSSFWKSCNAAGCTQAIFAGFIEEMNNICSRIQSDQASQQDYDLALTVMTASGKLAELVTKQHEELQRKKKELEKAAVAMEKVVSALSK